MKILIIEDRAFTAKKMAETLVAGIEGASVTVCTVTCEISDRSLPPMEEVVEKIKESDIVLLDWDLGSETPYNGADLFPICQSFGKRVVGISGDYEFPGVPSYRLKSKFLDWDSAPPALVEIVKGCF